MRVPYYSGDLETTHGLSKRSTNKISMHVHACAFRHIVRARICMYLYARMYVLYMYVYMCI